MRLRRAKLSGMLRTLSIRDVVLIDALDIQAAAGLCALTGETGAGKSILLDSLGLALGARGESGLVRQGAAQAGVSAAFEIDARHPVYALLRAAEIDVRAGEDLVLRGI